MFFPFNVDELLKTEDCNAQSTDMSEHSYQKEQKIVELLIDH
jgi:hypothetical protein